jgi:hypothetical protein
MREAVRLLTCASLILVFVGLAAAPLAGLIPQQDQCNCGCQHENGKLCCCRRAAREAAPALESALGCPGKCRYTTPVPLRLGLFLPLPSRTAAAALVVVTRASAGSSQAVPTVSSVYSLRDRSPPHRPIAGC